MRMRTLTHVLYQAGELVEAGFEYVTEIEEVAIFRMKK